MIDKFKNKIKKSANVGDSSDLNDFFKNWILTKMGILLTVPNKCALLRHLIKYCFEKISKTNKSIGVST